MTPMLEQYFSLKRAHPDAVLFFRMGDFYEMFFDDAVLAAPVLEVQLTSRDKSAENPIPMCGVPYHAVTQYLQKLIAKGHKVALCEQMENPEHAKGLVKREVVRVVTPALVADPDLVAEQTSNLLASVWRNGETIEIATLDLLGGDLRFGKCTPEKLQDLFSELEPKEILTTSELAKETWWPKTLITVRDEAFEKGAEGALRLYLAETQKQTDFAFVSLPKPLFIPDSLEMDATTLAALEILRPQSEGGHSLFETVDETVTPMGRRLLKERLAHPSCDRVVIEGRLDAVEELFTKDAREILKPVRDLERLASKTALGLALPRDLVALRAYLDQVPKLRALLGECKSKTLGALLLNIDPFEELSAELHAALEDAPPVGYRDGGIFKETYHPEIASLRALTHDAKSAIAAFEAKERERTGIASLKIKQSKVFGYTIEITKSHLSKVPKDYLRKQTIANGERFLSEKLSRFEEKLVSAEHRLKHLEESLFFELRARVAQSAPRVLAAAKAMAELDVLQSFAKVSKERGYVKPETHSGWNLDLEGARHAVVERWLPPGGFVPNDVRFDENETRTLILTGPNMAGKSTIMRQAALVVVLAQAGCFVPATRARMGIVDAIFTRIGSSDDLARGRSTFLVEMDEVARILRKATPRSLILIDEIGRGTSTYDGLALAWSILEFLHVEVRARTLFATHFHELTALEESHPALKNAHVLVEHWNGEIIFLHRLAAGVCHRSYGVDVARLAGLPSRCLLRAREILGVLETQSQRAGRGRHKAIHPFDNQMRFFETAEPSGDPLQS